MEDVSYPHLENHRLSDLDERTIPFAHRLRNYIDG